MHCAVLASRHHKAGRPGNCLHWLTAAPLPVCRCREEREQRRADIEHLAGSLVNKVNECVAAIDEGTQAPGPVPRLRALQGSPPHTPKTTCATCTALLAGS